MVEALVAAALVALASVVGVLFFGHDKRLVGVEKYAIPVAVGVFLSLVFYELVPETLAMAPTGGGVAIAAGFIAFYLLAHILHTRYHNAYDEDCDRKGAATLLMIGDAIHNVADGVILGSAFLIDPALGTATAIGLALHEVPQEIVEFGVFIRAGYTRMQAIMRNLLSASSIILGTLFVLLTAEMAQGYIWIITGIAAGNLLFLAASDLLPRIHGNLKNYGSIWHSTTAIITGFVVMTVVISWAHSQFEHTHDHGHVAEEVEDGHHHEEIDHEHNEVEHGHE